MVIGIIDDDKNEIDSIQRTIITIIKKYNLDINELKFKIYDLNSDVGKLTDNLIKVIVDDILKFEISILIIDHKIVVNSNEIFNGSDIFEQIRKDAPDFPTIIMTNVVEDSMKNNYVDPDKVYAKSEFFKIGEYAKEKTENMLKNVKRYNELRSTTQEELDELKSELAKNTENQDIVNKIVEKEKELDKYLPMQRSYLEEVINIEELKQILKLIEDAKKLME